VIVTITGDSRRASARQWHICASWAEPVAPEGREVWPGTIRFQVNWRPLVDLADMTVRSADGSSASIREAAVRSPA
jgi:hypothetical protein